MTHHRALPMSPSAQRRTRVRGFGAIAALVVLVILSVLGAAIARLGWTQQVSGAQDLDSARAQQAANAGAEWGLYQALKGSWTTCASASQTIDLRASMGVIVTVTCNSATFVEGEVQNGIAADGTPQNGSRTLRTFLIDAVACNGATSCPDNGMASSVAYVERRRQVQATDQ